MSDPDTAGPEGRPLMTPGEAYMDGNADAFGEAAAFAIGSAAGSDNPHARDAFLRAYNEYTRRGKECHDAKVEFAAPSPPEASPDTGREALAARHHPTTPVQCSCGWRMTDDAGATWLGHFANVLAAPSEKVARDPEQEKSSEHRRIGRTELGYTRDVCSECGSNWPCAEVAQSRAAALSRSPERATAGEGRYDTCRRCGKALNTGCRHRCVGPSAALPAPAADDAPTCTGDDHCRVKAHWPDPKHSGPHRSEPAPSWDADDAPRPADDEHRDALRRLTDAAVAGTSDPLLRRAHEADADLVRRSLP